MEYDQIIAKINSYLKFGRKLGLERMEKLMDLLGSPQEHMKILHVAGTNGKGSVCRYLYEALMANGYSVGMYTSPFLERFTERMEANGEEISAEELSICTDLVLAQADKLEAMGLESPTEFEIVTAIGFVYYKRMNVDFLVLEVGLGGRGDATNIVKNPLVTAITSISYDHTEYLGDTLEKIAIEKAGIVKPGVPMVCQVSEDEAKNAIARICQEKNADFYDVTDFDAFEVDSSLDGYQFSIWLKSLGMEYENVSLSMIGQHQIKNAVTALSVLQLLEELYNFPLDHVKVLEGMKRAIHRGRFEVLERQPFVIIDGAHNEAGIEAIKVVMDEHFHGKKVLTVMGILEDKINDELLRKMASFTDTIMVTKVPNPRAVEADDLGEAIAKATGKACIKVDNYKEAVKQAMESRANYDCVLFSGSLYLIGAVRTELRGYIHIEK